MDTPDRLTRSGGLTRCAQAAVLLLWAASALSAFGRHAWLLDLLANFRLHYAALFAVLAAALLIRRETAFAVAALAGLTASAAPALPYLQADGDARASEAAPTLRLVSLNVWFRNQDIQPIADYLRETDADVIVLQEAVSELFAQLRPLLADYPYVNADPHRHGAVILSRWPFVRSELKALTPGGSRAAYVEIAWRETTLRLYGVHLHWPLEPRIARLRDRQLDGLVDHIISAPGPVLVAGDFNATPWSPVFKAALRRSGLQDCGRGKGLAPSWPAQAPWLGLRIDHCLASSHFVVRDLRVGPSVGSDHRPLIVDLALTASAEPAS